MRIAIVTLLSLTLASASALACGDAARHAHGGDTGPGSRHHAASSRGSGDAGHGGDVFRRADVVYEIVAVSGEVQVYAYDRDGQPLDLGDTKGVVAPVSGGACDAEAVPFAPVATSDAEGGSLVAALPGPVGGGRCDEFRISLYGTPSRKQAEVTFLWAPGRSEGIPPRDGARHAH